MKTIKIERIFKKGKNTTSLIRLKGDWLKAAGFNAGEKVLITITNNQLILQTT